jgi:hypothetical protein
MHDLTNYAANMLARALCGRTPSVPTAVFAALGTGGTAAEGVTGEPVGNGYARQRVTFTGTGPQRNADALTFTFTAVLGVGTLTHIGLFDAATGGNPLTWGVLSFPLTVSCAGTVTIAAGDLKITPEVSDA